MTAVWSHSGHAVTADPAWSLCPVVPNVCSHVVVISSSPGDVPISDQGCHCPWGMATDVVRAPVRLSQRTWSSWGRGRLVGGRCWLIFQALKGF